jgi:hypothetical protein
MANVKVSELTQTASVVNTDLIEVSRDLGGGSWESRSMTLKTLNTSVSGPRVIIVSKSGTGDATTLEDGIAIANSLTPTQANPVVIQIMTGLYAENNPLTIPSFVSVEGVGGNNAVAISANNDSDNIIQISGTFVSVTGLTIKGAHGSGGIGVYITGSYINLANLVIYECETGCKVSGASSFANGLNLTVLVIPPYITQDGFLAVNGSSLILSSSGVQGIPGPISGFNAYRADGVGSIVSVLGCSSGYMSSGCYVDSGGKIIVSGGIYQNGTNGLKIGPNGTGSQIVACGVDLTGNGSYDVYISDGVAGIVNLNGKYDAYKRYIGTGGSLASLAQDGSIGGTRSTGIFIQEGPAEIGTPGFSTLYPTSDLNLNVGEGAATRYDNYGEEIVEYWQWNNVASSLTRFSSNAGVQLAGNNDAIIVGTLYPYTDIRLQITTAANVGASSFTAEYWDGATWVSSPYAVNERSTFVSRSNNPFQNVETQFVEMDVNVYPNMVADSNVPASQIPLWDNGYDMYVMRFRNNGALVSGMTFTDGCIKPDTWTVGVSRRNILFGNYRHADKESQIITIDNMTPDPDNPPSAYTVNVSSHIKFDLNNALFTQNNVCAINFAVQLPWWADTATPSSLLIDFMPTSTNVGSVDFCVHFVKVNVGTIFDGTVAEGHADLSTNTSGVAYEIQRTDVPIDTSSFSPGDLFRVSIERDGTTDTYNDDIVVLRAVTTFTRKLLT